MNRDTVFAFVEAINRQDLPCIIGMMAEDFCFIDTHDGRENKEQMKTGWQGYFDWFPDYRIEIEDYIEAEEFCVLLGRASASYQGREDKHWDIPACWKAVAREGQIHLWQVYCDAKKQLDSMQ